jgi:hypothetical protein
LTVSVSKYQEPVYPNIERKGKNQLATAGNQMTIFEDKIKALKSNTQALKILRKSTVLLIYSEALRSIVLQLMECTRLS